MTAASKNIFLRSFHASCIFAVYNLHASSFLLVFPWQIFFSILKFVIFFFLRSTPTFRLFSKYDVLKLQTEEMFLSLGACGEMTSDFEWRVLQLPVCPWMRLLSLLVFIFPVKKTKKPRICLSFCATPCLTMDVCCYSEWCHAIPCGLFLHDSSVLNAAGIFLICVLVMRFCD